MSSPNSDTRPLAPRKPLWAGLMSLLLPGFGQAYNGELNKAAWIFLAFTLLTIPAIAFVALYLPSSLMLPVLVLCLLLLLGLWIFSIFDAVRQARLRPDHQIRPWQSSAFYAWVFIVCGIITLPLLTLLVREHMVESFYIPSASMQPQLQRGDVLFVDKRYNNPRFKHAVAAGDMAIFVYPNNRTNYYIKRIIGLPGDRIALRGRELWVNDQQVSTALSDANTREQIGDVQWTAQWDSSAQDQNSLELTVPAGEVFVLGDNRNNSKDSRHFGTVPLQDVVGKARQIWFSWDQDGVRWDRVGLVL